MKIKISLFISLFFSTCLNAQESSLWRMIFEDEFSASTFDTRYWSYCTRANPDWAKYLTSSSETVNTVDGLLKVKLIKNTNTGTDNVPYLSGGIQSRKKFNFTYGKVEVRAKFSNGQGSWPAIWMMPEDGSAGWPACGEIDIMEHVNSEDRIYQTIHSDFVNTQGNRNPSPTQTTSIDKNAFNVYGVEWHPDRLDFTLNGNVTFSYPRINTTKTGQWPFDKPFYIILNMAGGGSWTGPISEAALPFEMQVDWVKVYERNPEGPYIIPAWKSAKTQNDPYWANTFVQQITTSGAQNDINFQAQKRHETYYYQHPDTLLVTEGSNLDFNLKAFSLGNYTESKVLQDLRYTCNYVFADFDGDKRFEMSLPRIGKVPPSNGVGGNMDVMNITRSVGIPYNKDKNGRIRIVYDNAWNERYSPEIYVYEGVVYDFPIRITAQNTGIKDKIVQPTVKRVGDVLISDYIEGNFKVEVFNPIGQQLINKRFTDSSLNEQLPKGLMIIRITDSSGRNFRYKM